MLYAARDQLGFMQLFGMLGGQGGTGSRIDLGQQDIFPLCLGARVAQAGHTLGGGDLAGDVKAFRRFGVIPRSFRFAAGLEDSTGLVADVLAVIEEASQ